MKWEQADHRIVLPSSTEVLAMSTMTPLRVHHSTGWPPGSTAGRWAVGLAGVALAGTAVLVIAFATGLEHAESFSDNWLLTGAAATVTATAIGSSLSGLVALAARHDRSWAVLTATVTSLALSALFLQQVAEGLGWLSA